MAGNNSIQFLRGTSSQISSSTQVALAGQPVFATDTNQLYIGDGNTQIKNLIPVNTEGSYPTLGAGYLAKELTVENGANINRYYKLCTFTSPKIDISNSFIFVINGIYGDQPTSYAAESGLLEWDIRSNSSGVSDTNSGLSILGGNLNTSDFFYVISDDLSTISLYCYLSQQYGSLKITELSNDNLKYDVVFDGTAYTSAPSGAVYAVNRNLADYNSAGAALVDVASAQQISGAKIFVKGIKAANPASNSYSDDVATTKWVNDKGYITLTGSQTITGDKTFTGDTSISNLTNSNNYKGLFFTTFIATFNNGTGHRTQGIAPKNAMFYICVPSTSNDGPFLARGSASSLYTESNYNGTVTCYAICY